MRTRPKILVSQTAALPIASVYSWVIHRFIAMFFSLQIQPDCTPYTHCSDTSSNKSAEPTWSSAMTVSSPFLISAPKFL